MFLEKDIFLIYKLAFPKEKNRVFILDPQKMVLRNYKESGFNYVRTRNDITRLADEKRPYILINTSGARTFKFPLDFENVEGIITLNRFLEVSELFYHHELFYSKRKDQHITWLYDSYYRDHDFLLDSEEVESVIDMANIGSFFPSSLKYFRLWLGDIKGVSDGQIQILSKKDTLFEPLKKGESRSFSIKMNAANATNIISIIFKKRRKISKILKQAVNEPALKNLGKENDIFQQLSKDEVSQATYQFSDNFSLLTLPENTRKLSALRIQKSHYQHLLEKIIRVNKSFQDEISLKTLLKKTDTLRSLNVIKMRLLVKKYPRGLGILNFTKIYTHLVRIFNDFADIKSVPVSLANLNINPSTSFYSGENIFFTSWVTAGKQYPLLFDLFDIEFRRQEGYDYPEVEKLIADLEYLASDEDVQGYLQQTGTDFNSQLRLYLLVRIPREMVFTLSKEKIIPEQNLKFYLWSEFFKYYRFN